MKQERFSEQTIVDILREAETAEKSIMEVFYSIAKAATIIESRRHGSLGYHTPAEFAANWQLLSGTMEQSARRTQTDISLRRQ